jgi:hypothetical protein
MKYTLPKKAGATLMFHFIAVGFAFGYFFSDDYKVKSKALRLSHLGNKILIDFLSSFRRAHLG